MMPQDILAQQWLIVLMGQGALLLEEVINSCGIEAIDAIIDLAKNRLLSLNKQKLSLVLLPSEEPPPVKVGAVEHFLGSYDANKGMLRPHIMGLFSSLADLLNQLTVVQELSSKLDYSIGSQKFSCFLMHQYLISLPPFQASILQFDILIDPILIWMRRYSCYCRPKVASVVAVQIKFRRQDIANLYHYSLRVYSSILYLRVPQSFKIVLRGRVVEHHNIANDLKFPEFILYKPHGGNMEVCISLCGPVYFSEPQGRVSSIFDIKVGSSAKLGNSCQLYPGSHIFGNTELGDHCILMSGAVVGDDLPGHTVIGCNNVMGHHSVVGIKCQDMKYKSGDECFLEIGDNNEIREYASIHRSSKPSEKTVIGDNNLIMGSCHIAHDCKVGNNNIFANNTLLAGHVVVEDYAHTAGAIVVHQFCSIGSFSLRRYDMQFDVKYAYFNFLQSIPHPSSHGLTPHEMGFVGSSSDTSICYLGDEPDINAMERVNVAENRDIEREWEGVSLPAAETRQRYD
ncbi:hypothetical protein LOK49_LG02G01481, partial [Camellia lanceoleosa]